MVLEIHKNIIYFEQCFSGESDEITRWMRRVIPYKYRDEYYSNSLGFVTLLISRALLPLRLGEIVCEMKKVMPD